MAQATWEVLTASNPFNINPGRSIILDTGYLHRMCTRLYNYISQSRTNLALMLLRVPRSTSRYASARGIVVPAWY